MKSVGSNEPQMTLFSESILSCCFYKAASHTNVRLAMEECFHWGVGKLLVLSNVCAFHPRGFCNSVLGEVSVPVFSLVPSRYCEA